MKTRSNSSHPLAETLGEQLRALRLQRDLDQATVAARAGIGTGAVKRLESGGGATLNTFIGVLTVLGREDWLATLASSVNISPPALLERPTPRQRASGRRKGSPGADKT